MFPFSGTGLVGVLALTLLAGCTGSRQSQPQSNDTRINETSFRLTVPGLWKSGSAGDPTRRDYHTDNEQLTVSIFGSLFGKPGTMEHTARVTTFRRWVNKRRDIEGRLPGLANVQRLSLPSRKYEERWLRGTKETIQRTTDVSIALCSRIQRHSRLSITKL